MKRRIFFVLEILLLSLFLGVLFIYGQISQRIDKLETSTSLEEFDEQKLEVNESAPRMTGYRTIALFGLDHRTRNAELDGENSDTIIVASINNDTSDVKLVSVYRDTLLNIGNETYTKANAAYAYGGPQQAVSMLNTNLDLDITDFITVDFNAVVNLIDAVGGLDIPMSYAEIVHMNNYSIETAEETGKTFTPIALPAQEPADLEEIIGTYHLNGVQATSYCRIRYTASMDMGRTERQRRVIQMVVHKLKRSGLNRIFEILDEIIPMVKTSLTKTEIMQMIPIMIGYRIDDTTGFPLNFKFSMVQGSSFIVADPLLENVRDLHKFLYGSFDNYVPSSNISEINDYIFEIVGGESSLQETAPVQEEDADTSNDFVWTAGNGSVVMSDAYGTGYTDESFGSGWNTADTGTDQDNGIVMDNGAGEVHYDNTYTEPVYNDNDSTGDDDLDDYNADYSGYNDNGGDYTYVEPDYGYDAGYDAATDDGDGYDAAAQNTDGGSDLDFTSQE